MRLVWGTVDAIGHERDDLQRLDVTADGTDSPSVALCYPALSGRCEPGDRVLLNTTAVDLSLGTGGAHVVVTRVPAGEREARGVALDDPSGGHVMKLRYTPLQRDVMAVEAPESPGHALLENAVDVGGMPVVCCGLHSHVALIAAAIKERSRHARVAYLMTDEAALPLALSDVVAHAVEQRMLDLTVTCGQAFGGMLEAVNLYSGLVAARVVGEADIAIVAIGPGVVGTGTVLGHGGIAQGEAINAVAAVGGRAVASLRLSFADARERHRGVSHHTITALTRIALAPALVAVPELDPVLQGLVDDDLRSAGVWERHERVFLSSVLPEMHGVPLRSMGRAPEDDPAFFLAASAAGAVAADLL